MSDDGNETNASAMGEDARTQVAVAACPRPGAYGTAGRSRPVFNLLKYENFTAEEQADVRLHLGALVALFAAKQAETMATAALSRGFAATTSGLEYVVEPLFEGTQGETGRELTKAERATLTKTVLASLEERVPTLSLQALVAEVAKLSKHPFFLRDARYARRADAEPLR